MEMNKLIKPCKIKEWIDQIAIWKEKYPLTYTKDTKLVKPQYVIEKLSELTKGNAIIATEVGQHQMWVAQYYQFLRPRTLLTSGGLGTMGYGLPASIGAKVACNDKIVINIAGDGSLQMNIQELATAISHDIKIKVIILNNGYLGMVRQWQELFYSKRYSGVCLGKTDKRGEICGYYPDFLKIAEAYGFWGKRITTNEEVENALKELLEVNEPALLDIWIEKEENVFPMVPAGANLTQMIGGLA